MNLLNSKKKLVISIRNSLFFVLIFLVHLSCFSSYAGGDEKNNTQKIDLSTIVQGTWNVVGEVKVEGTPPTVNPRTVTIQKSNLTVSAFFDLFSADYEIIHKNMDSQINLLNLKSKSFVVPQESLNNLYGKYKVEFPQNSTKVRVHFVFSSKANNVPESVDKANGEDLTRFTLDRNLPKGN